MLRTLYFNGGGGGALAFLDPVKGTIVDEIPVVGKSSKVSFRGIIAYTDTPTIEEIVSIAVGSDGAYHDLQVFPRGDGDNITAGLGLQDMIPLGDFIAGENEAISGTAFATGLTAGVLYYDDGEPNVAWPEGRHVFMTSLATGDLATALAETNIAQPNATKPLSVNSNYYLYAVTSMPENTLLEAFILKNSDGRCACAAPKGRVIFPTCPLILDGNDSPSVLGQVQAAGRGSAIWEMIEVPKPGKEALVSGVQVSPLPFGGSVQLPMAFTGGGGGSILGLNGWR